MLWKNILKKRVCENVYRSLKISFSGKKLSRIFFYARVGRIFEISAKFWIFDTPYDLFKNYWLVLGTEVPFWRIKSESLGEEGSGLSEHGLKNIAHLKKLPECLKCAAENNVFTIISIDFARSHCNTSVTRFIRMSM